MSRMLLGMLVRHSCLLVVLLYAATEGGCKGMGG